MPVYTIETCYGLPVYRVGNYFAATPEAACEAAVQDDDWDNEKRDYDALSRVHVTGIWLGEDAAYRGHTIATPDHFRETLQRKAEMFETLLALLKEPAQPLGLSQHDFESWLPRALSAIIRSDAIVADSDERPALPSLDPRQSSP